MQKDREYRILPVRLNASDACKLFQVMKVYGYKHMATMLKHLLREEYARLRAQGAITTDCGEARTAWRPSELKRFKHIDEQ